MEYEKLKTTALPLEEVLEKLKSNNTFSFEWYAVKNKKGSLLEVGGRNQAHLELKIYVPRFENGKYFVYGNGYVNHAYSLYLDGKIELVSLSGRHSLNKEEFIKFINETDFKKYFPKIKEKEIKEIRIVKTIVL